MKESKRYQLRYAAGSYWLLDMQQERFAYQNPAALNECGADIFSLYAEGKSIPQIAECLHQKYGVSRTEAADDAAEFLKKLKEHGISRQFGEAGLE